MPPAHFVCARHWFSSPTDGKLACIMPDDQQVTAPVPSPAAPSDIPQFSTAEYAHIPGTERCRICGNPISGEYYRVNTQMACGKCALEAKAGQPSDSHAAFARGLLLGAGAALLGLILYAAFTIISGLYLGYIALGVGWLVGMAISKGSGGMGGRRYQIAAVVLTYCAISIAAIPIWIAYGMKHAKSHTAQTQQNAGSTASDASSARENAAEQPSAPSEKPNLVKFLVQALFIGLASPFLELRDPFHGLIGLVILFVGLRIAFKMTAVKPLDVDGPYSVTA
jgi:hypothetical protein